MMEFNTSDIKISFLLGLQDGFNPCALTTILIFILLMACIGTTNKKVFYIGSLFIIIAGVTQFTILLGFWDYFMLLEPIIKSIRILYSLIAVIFISLSIINIVDWWKYKKIQNVDRFILKVPAFLKLENKNVESSVLKKILINFVIFILTILSVFLFTVIGSIYPQSEYVYVVHSYMFSGGNKFFVYKTFFIYSFAMIFLLIISWFSLLWLSMKKRQGLSTILNFKGINASLLLAIGIGLGMFIINK